MPATTADVLVVGGGMAGATVAAALAPSCRVLLVETEDQLAHHATGRSAAAFLETYGPPPVRLLTRASRPLVDAAADEAGVPLLRPRPFVTIARADQLTALDAELQEHPTLERLDATAAREVFPALRPGHIAAAAVERDAADIDVAALHQAHLRRLRAAGGEVRTGSPVLGGERRAGTWRVDLGTGRVEAGVVVDAAGAWADEVATRLGARPVGLVPKRRTAALARAATPVGSDWPLAVDVGGGFYVKPEGPHVLVSPVDATPVAPCDARPEEADVALALERVAAATTLGLRSVVRAWAGLRTFAPDGLPVVGADPAAEGFVWLAGQGGYGIQMAPALAALAAALVTAAPVPAALAGLDVEALGPGRPELLTRAAAVARRVRLPGWQSWRGASTRRRRCWWRAPAPGCTTPSSACSRRTASTPSPTCASPSAPASAGPPSTGTGRRARRSSSTTSAPRRGRTGPQPPATCGPTCAPSYPPCGAGSARGASGRC
jgi:D-arginine dehydrogenase